MFQPGDVVLVRSALAGKPKFHLCVTLQNGFLFLNSYKGRDYPGSIVVDNDAFPFLNPTPTGRSVVNVSMVLRLSHLELRGAQLKGRAGVDMMLRILREAENSRVLSAEDRELIVAGLGDFF